MDDSARTVPAGMGITLDRNCFKMQKLQISVVVSCYSQHQRIGGNACLQCSSYSTLSAIVEIPPGGPCLIKHFALPTLHGNATCWHSIYVPISYS